MSNVRARSPNIRRPLGKTDTESSGGKAKWIIAVIVLLLMAVGAWAFFPSSDPALARVQELRDQLETAPPEQRRELFGKMRSEFENLTPESRDQMRDEWRQRWEAREQKMLNEFFALTPAQQVAKIDEDIKEEEQRRAEREKRRAEEGNRRQGQAGGGPGGGGPGAGRGGGDRGGNGRGGGGRDSAERRKSYLDSTSPEARAQRSEYRRMREERRKELGLPERGGGGGGRGR